ncbi:MAG TPA: DsbA family protein [Usitatibacter sp.]|nr:DsbA family protein [Usitatibacter sp.]
MSANAALRLLYVADPLCSWCYGFGPELSRVLERHPGAGPELVMGGLRPYNTQPMSEAFRDMLRGHWKHVHEASGMPFSEAIFAQPGFVYDTEPPCRAVVAARALDAARAFALLKDIQAAFYRDGIDMTRAEALAEAASRCGYDRRAFLGAFDSEEMRDATRADFERARSLGVSGFPTLAAELDGQLYLVASGFTPSDVIEDRLGQIALRVASAQPNAETDAR